MGREDYHWVQGGKLGTGMFVLDIGGNAHDGSVPEGVLRVVWVRQPRRGERRVSDRSILSRSVE